MKKIVFATTNQGKINEMKDLLKDQYEIVTSKQIGYEKEIEETGSTFAENAEIKANAIVSYLREKELDNEYIFVISEDAGFIVNAMPNQLGVYSARFMEGADYDIKNAEIIRRVANASDKRCKYVSDICLIQTNGDVKHFVGEVEGYIGDRPLGNGGFAYDPIFYLGEDKTMATISKEEKNEISHRSIAVRSLIDYLNK